MSLLFDLTLRGSIAALVVIALDRIASGMMAGRSRRWWWCFIPIAFLVPLRVPMLPGPSRLPAVAMAWNHTLMKIPNGVTSAGQTGTGHAFLAEGLWLIGAIAYVALVAVQTARASRRWSRERLSTDHALLELLEDCKAETGVTAPIGLVISNSVPSPAIMGWLRPRILIPASLADSAHIGEMRPIMLHELAHFRWYDVPFSWLLTVVRAAHWFNPLAHAAAFAWARFREEAADEAAMKWMRDDSGQAYGMALMQTLRQTRNGSVPFGSLAIVESVGQLKRRITMINRCKDRAPRILLAALVSLLLTVVVFSKAAHAVGSATGDQKAAVFSGIKTWLAEVDGGKYALSWTDASSLFKTQVGSDKWVEMLTDVRAPLGKCVQRAKVSFAFEKNPDPKGVIKGDFAMVQFESSFENMKHAVETVAFFKEADGTWKAAGYVIRP